MRERVHAMERTSACDGLALGGGKFFRDHGGDAMQELVAGGMGGRQMKF